MSVLRGLGDILLVAMLLAAVGAGAQAQAQTGKRALKEDYIDALMPPGFKVTNNELEGPLFADANGKTLYTWPRRGLRNGSTGDQKDDKPACDDTRQRVNSGLMSPYPAGFVLPEVETRPSCIQLWPPVAAAADAKPVGLWTIVEQKNGSKQWAYDGYPLYTSVLDQQPGDSLGGSRRPSANDGGVEREPVGPMPNAPPQFIVYSVAQGRLLGTAKGYSVYTSESDGPNKSSCYDRCLLSWSPILAPELAMPLGEWSVFERAPGVKQWAFRKMPLYTRIADNRVRSYRGSDVPGWQNVFTQKAPAPPKGFTIQDTRAGQVVATPEGKTIYLYNCTDDALDQQSCDNPDSPQAYRFAICGGGDPTKCVATFPYVIADKDAKSNSRSWSVINIDPKTGRKATSGEPGALRVWAFRGRPVYTFYADRRAGDVEGDSWGEFNGHRNGYKAFWLRDDFFGNAG